MDKKIRVTLIGTIVNIIIPPLKFWGGIVGKSGALIADGIHSLSDLLSDAMVFLFIHVANKPRDKSHDYGHGKYETIATLFISLILVGAGIWIMIDATGTIYSYFKSGILPQRPSLFALLIAFLSIISKEWLYHITRKVAKETNSSALMANAWHHRSDSYSSIAVLLGVTGAMLFDGVGLLLEPIAAFIVAVFIVHVAIKLGLPSINQLAEESLPDEVEYEILRTIGSVPGILNPHNLRTRYIGNNIAIEADVRVHPDMTVSEAHDLTEEIESKLRDKYGINTHIVIHVEPLK